MNDKPKPPRRVWVEVTKEVLPLALPVLHQIGEIVNMAPASSSGDIWRVDIENNEWPDGVYAQAIMHCAISVDTYQVTHAWRIVLP